MSLKTKIIFGALLVVLLTGLLLWLILPERLFTRVDKTLLQYFGGDCVVEVYSGGQKIRDYQVNGYVLFENSESNSLQTASESRHDGVITFKDKQGRNVRLGAWGGTVLVECK